MTQAAVSYQVRLLEERLGTPLFRRERGRVTLTPSARRAATITTGALDALTDAFAGLRADDDAVLRISCANTFAVRWLAPRIGAFQLAHPDLAVRLDATDTIADFARDDVDVGIRAGLEPAGLHTTRLFDISFTPMASPAFLARHPLPAPTALLDVPRLTPDDPWWSIWFAAAGVADVPARTGGLRLDSQVSEAGAAIGGAGVGLLNTRMWQPELAGGLLVAPFELNAGYGGSFWLISSEARRNVPKIKAFREWIVAAAAA